MVSHVATDNFGGGKLAADAVPRASQTLQPIGLDARLGPTHTAAQRTPLVVLVVGETARAANFSLGGYARATNQALAGKGVAELCAMQQEALAQPR